MSRNPFAIAMAEAMEAGVVVFACDVTADTAQPVTDHKSKRNGRDWKRDRDSARKLKKAMRESWTA